MGTLETPRLRPLSARAVTIGGVPCVQFEDSLGLAAPGTAVPSGFYQFLRRFDGRTSVEAIARAHHAESGELVRIEDLREAVRRLDEALILDGPSFEALRRRYAAEPVRPAAHAGRSYPADPRELSRLLDGYIGAGRPPGTIPGRPLRGIMSPHIDFARGGATYGAAFAELADRPGPEVFVILGVAHQYCGNRFALTRKHFSTPLGTATTDRAYVDAIAELAGPGLFDDELAHRTEHSIELEVAFLQRAMRGRPFTIVPILVGSFRDLMRAGLEPIDDPSVRRMVEALRQVEARSGRRVCTIGGVDMSHVGPEFGDPGPADDAMLDLVGRRDLAMLDRALVGDAAGWHAVAAEVDDRHRVCGLDAMYTMLHAIGPTRGRLLRYDQAVNPARTCAVTFAGVAFDGHTDEH